MITHRQIGHTLFTVVAQCAPDATETISGKLERLMMRRLTDARSYPVYPDGALAEQGTRANMGLDGHKKRAK